MSSNTISQELIAKHLSSLGLSVNKENIKNTIKTKDRNIKDFIRGKFVLSSINFLLKSINLNGTHDNIINRALLSSFNRRFSNEHPHHSYYKNCIDNIIIK
tara:strand:- start:424 stop:726 length:303 start_codon:yes stop_codon:yes gene_type:complete